MKIDPQDYRIILLDYLYDPEIAVKYLQYTLAYDCTLAEFRQALVTVIEAIDLKENAS